MWYVSETNPNYFLDKVLCKLSLLFLINQDFFEVFPVEVVNYKPCNVVNADSVFNKQASDKVREVIV